PWRPAPFRQNPASIAADAEAGIGINQAPHRSEVGGPPRRLRSRGADSRSDSDIGRSALKRNATVLHLGARTRREHCCEVSILRKAGHSPFHENRERQEAGTASMPGLFRGAEARSESGT